MVERASLPPPSCRTVGPRHCRAATLPSCSPTRRAASPQCCFSTTPPPLSPTHQTASPCCCWSVPSLLPRKERRIFPFRSAIFTSAAASFSSVPPALAAVALRRRHLLLLRARRRPLSLLLRGAVSFSYTLPCLLSTLLLRDAASSFSYAVVPIPIIFVASSPPSKWYRGLILHPHLFQDAATFFWDPNAT